MKTINNIFLITIGLTFILVSCSDVIEEEPSTFLAPENLNSELGAEAVVKGAYQIFQISGYYQRELLAQVEIKSEYAKGRGSYLPVGDYNLDANGVARVDQVWSTLYSGINRANVIISSFEDLNLPEDKKAQWMAEAKVLRALHYFHIARLFGAAPLRVEAADDLNNLSAPKSSVNDIYDQIIDDLTSAINSGALPESYPDVDLGRATVYAAKAILSEVYLTLEDYTNAANTANEIISSGEFTLEPDMYKIFSADELTHAGDIFSVKFARINGLGTIMPNFLNNQQLGYSSAGWRVFLVNVEAPLIMNWDTNDIRHALNLYNDDPNTPEGAVLTSSEPGLFKKYIDKDYAGGNTSHGNDFAIYRYADVLTIYAEASAMANNGPTDDSYEALNKIRRRAYGVDINTPDPTIDYSGLTLEEFREAVWTERAYEFMMEGRRWYDMLRMGEDKAKQIAADANLTLGDEDFLFPIPRQEIDNNDQITEADQNPGY